ncbi:unnamed protein product [Lactuca virosa]|uniref:Uncharacterized protein n=1 Tax=Lactuca virosa TaxID=75947 RepID=A0AAU9N9F1_9ASTR|nr:unnamed protein product [Lactuca virosa]
MCRSDLRSEEGKIDAGSSTLTSIAVFSGLQALWSMGTAEKEENDGKREDLWGLARPKEEATKLRWPSVGADGSCRAAVGRLGWSQSAFPFAFLMFVSVCFSCFRQKSIEGKDGCLGLLFLQGREHEIGAIDH